MPDTTPIQKELEKFLEKNKRDILPQLFLVNLDLLFANPQTLNKKAQEYAKELTRHLSPHPSLYKQIEISFYKGILHLHQNFATHLKFIIQKRYTINHSSHQVELLAIIKLFNAIKSRKNFPEKIALISNYFTIKHNRRLFDRSIQPHDIILLNEPKWKGFYEWCINKDKIRVPDSFFYFCTKSIYSAFKIIASLISINIVALIMIYFFRSEFAIRNLSTQLLKMLDLGLSYLRSLTILMSTFYIAHKVFKILSNTTMRQFMQEESDKLTHFLENFYQLTVLLEKNNHTITREISHSHSQKEETFIFTLIPREPIYTLQGERLPRNSLRIKENTSDKNKNKKMTIKTSDKAEDEQDLIDESGNDIVRTFTHKKTLMRLRLPKRIVHETDQQKIAPFDSAFRTAQVGLKGTCIKLLNKEQAEIKVSHNKYRLFGTRTAANEFTFDTFRKGLHSK